MSLLNSTLLGAAFCALASSAAAQSTPPAKPATPGAVAEQSRGIARASDLIGRNVVDRTDQVLGEVKDFIACDTGELVALIEREGDGKLVGAPMSALLPRLDHKGDTAAQATVKVDRFVTDAGARLANAPVVADRDQIDSAWWTAFVGHYGITRTDPANPDKPEAATGMNPACRPGAVCIETLIGQDVKSAAGEDIGDVKDVAVDLANGKVAYIVISTGRMLGMQSTLHGVPSGALVPDTERRFVTLQTDKATLERTTGIDIDRLPARPNFEVSATVPASADRG
jgi:sporulation protein YlmC with PRC-barrel domain